MRVTAVENEHNICAHVARSWIPAPGSDVDVLLNIRWIAWFLVGNSTKPTITHNTVSGIVDEEDRLLGGRVCSPKSIKNCAASLPLKALVLRNNKLLCWA